MRIEISNNKTFLMGMAMLGVMVFHQMWFRSYIFRPLSICGLWGVDIFQFLSGFGCVYALNKYTTSIFFKRRVLRLLPSCVFVGITLLSIDYIMHRVKWLEPMTFMRIGSLQMWYIQLILVSYLLSPLALKILKQHKLVGLVALCILSFISSIVLSNTSFLFTKWIMFRLPVFFFGMYVALYDYRLSTMRLVVLAVILFSVIVYKVNGGSRELIWAPLIAISMPLILKVLIMIGAKINTLKGFYSSILKTGEYSLEIYLIHEYIMGNVWMIAKHRLLCPLVFIILLLCSAYILRFCTKTLVKQLGRSFLYTKIS